MRRLPKREAEAGALIPGCRKIAGLDAFPPLRSGRGMQADMLCNNSSNRAVYLQKCRMSLGYFLH